MEKSYLRLINSFLIAFISAILVFVTSTRGEASVVSHEPMFTFNYRGTVGEVIQLIEKQSNYRFFYQKSQLNLNRHVRLRVKNGNINFVLSKLFDRNEFCIRILDNHLIVVSRNGDTPKAERAVVQCKGKRITGRVTDEEGKPIVGATVLVKEMAKGTISDANGNYAIVVKEQEVLVFSFIGMETKSIPLRGQEVVNVVLKAKSHRVNEVVVTALGMKRETKELGYAVTEIKGSEIASANCVSPVSALQGKAAGVSISGTDGGVFGGAKIQIRGVSTLGSNNQPIFVIDGVILDNTTSGNDEWNSGAGDWGNMLKNLNPDDFESVSLLKGAASTALYGSRGLNGAVIITTKSGTSSGEGFGLNVSQTTGVDVVYKTPDFQNEYGPGVIPGYVDYGDVNSATGGFYPFRNKQFYSMNVNGMSVHSYVNHPEYGLDWGPKYDSSAIYGFDQKMTTFTAYPDNMKDAYDTGFLSNTNISVQGGDDKTKIYVSDSYNYRKGCYPGNDFTRNSLFIKVFKKLSNRLCLDASVNFTLSTPRNPAGDLGAYFLDGTFDRGYNTKYYKTKYTADHGGVPNTLYNDVLGNVPGTAVWFGINNNSDERKESVIRPIIKLTAEVTDWMKLILEGNMNLYSYNEENKQLGQGYKNDGGYYGISSYSQQQKTARINVKFHKAIDRFTGNLTLGGEFFNTTENSTSANTNGGFIVPGQYFLNNSKQSVSTNGEIGQRKTLTSLYYLLSLGWKDHFFLDITGRNDWSSALVYANGTGNNSYFYPSVSGSWIFSQTFSLPEWMSFGKLRASWAQVGNDTKSYIINGGYSAEKLTTISSIYTNSYSLTLIDPNIQPERKNSIELGTDVRFFNNRLGIDLALYKDDTHHQIVQISVPTESGMTSQLTNAGNIQNKGIELGINSTPVKAGDFKWDLNFNYYKNWNKIISLASTSGEYTLLAGSPAYGNYRVGSVAYIGGEYGVLLSDACPAIDAATGKEILKYSNTSRSSYIQRSLILQKIGSIMPNFQGGVTNNFFYKGFSLGILTDLRFGGTIASYSNRYGNAYGFLKSSLVGRDAAHGGMTWTSKYDGITYDDGIIPNGVFAPGTNVNQPDGTSIDVSGMTYEQAYKKGYVEPTHAEDWTFFTNSWGQGVVNKTWVSRINYIALRQVSLGYDFPEKIARKLKLTKLHISLDGRNLCYLYNSLPNHLNPESSRGNSSDYSYFERSFDPYIATYSFTVRLGL